MPRSSTGASPTNPSNPTPFRLSLPESAYKEDSARAAFYDRLLGRLSALPGVRAAGAVMRAPLTGAHFNLSFAGLHPQHAR